MASYRSWLDRFPIPLRALIHAGLAAIVMIAAFTLLDLGFGGGVSYATVVVLAVVLGAAELIDTRKYRRPLLIAWVVASALALPAVVVLGVLDPMEVWGERIAWLFVVGLFAANLVMSWMELRKHR